jgi:peptide/nickel transport system substrate-binding protein
LQTGGVQIIEAPFEHVLRLKEAGFKVYESIEVGTHGIWFNLTKPPLDNKLVRQAINYALNRSAFVNVIAYGHGVPAISYIPPAVVDYFNPHLKGYDYNLTKAKELLAAAGYPDGFKGVIMCDPTVTTGGSMLSQAILAKEQLSKVGIDLTIVTHAPGQIANALFFQDWMFMSLLWYGGGPTPYGVLYDWAHSSNDRPYKWNYQHIRNAELDTLLEQLKTEPLHNLTRAKELCERAQRILIDEAYGAPLYYFSSVHVTAPEIEGYTVTPVFSNAYGHAVYLQFAGINVQVKK